MLVSQFPGVTTPPKYESEFLRFMNPLLDVLREKGGQARPREIYDVIAQRLNLSDEQRTATLKSGSLKFENQIAWARSYLVKTGYLDSPSHGIWRLTDKGKDAHLDGPDIDSIFQRVLEMKTLSAAGKETAFIHDSAAEKEPVAIGEEDEAIAPSPQTSPYSDHRPALIALIGGMTPAGFEEFCSELLARVGVEDVQTTRYAKDGGIDGIGRLRINEFVSQPIAFQAKKFDGSGRKVSSEEIQRFRGAIGGHIAKGIFFTTTSFSEDAKREAKALGKVEIELVDLDRILEICENYQIGLNEQKILVAEPSFFERFRN
ncbi:winged helix-turn-helix domain-containing protein [Methylocystis sp.]|uniref:winged helix-turn-helix domain-containing protein n=1 Tax=Methylocystis sp. TaxID=1911079 RepID=UPI0025D6257D|nr:winged helix-turn-helix domain-containing protein [Methylocystis sp.]